MPPADTRRAFTGAPCGTPANKCLHVLSSFQRTGFHDAPHQLYFLRGNPPILRMRPCPVKPPESASSIFLSMRRPSRASATRRPSPLLMSLAARCSATWEFYELKEVSFDSALIALRRNGGSRSVQPLYVPIPGLSTARTASPFSSAGLAVALRSSATD